MASNSTEQSYPNSSATPTMTTDSSNITTLVPMAVLIFLVNSFVLFLFANRKKLRTPSNYLLFSLAVSDLITGVINIPLYFVAFEVYHESKEIKNRLAMAYITFSKLTTAAAAYHILLVTAEKYLAIVKPLRHHSSNPKNIFKCIGVVWLVSIVIGLVPLVCVEEPAIVTVKCAMGHDIFCFITVFLLPYIFIVYAQVVMLRAIAQRTRRNDLVRTTASKRQRKLAIANEKKCICIFAAMATMFLVCWLPWFTLMSLLTMSVAIPSMYGKIYFPEEMLRFFIIIRFCTCIINPMLYTFFKRDFMLACRSVWYRCILKRDRTDSGNTTVNEKLTRRILSKRIDGVSRPSQEHSLLPPLNNGDRVSSTVTDEVAVQETCL